MLVNDDWWTTLWYLELGGEESQHWSPLTSTLFLLKPPPPPVQVLRQESWCRSIGLGEEEMVTGGMSIVLSCGGGCCHWGSGPAKRSVFRSGPASITASKNFPFSGNGFLGTILSVTSAKAGGGDTGCRGSNTAESLPAGDAMTFSSQSEEERFWFTFHKDKKASSLYKQFNSFCFFSFKMIQNFESTTKIGIVNSFKLWLQADSQAINWKLDLSSSLI